MGRNLVWCFDRPNYGHCGTPRNVAFRRLRSRFLEPCPERHEALWAAEFPTNCQKKSYNKKTKYDFFS